MSSPLVSISILDARLRLLRLPRSQQEACAWAIIRVLWFRSTTGAAQFFSLTSNNVECSIFCDESLAQDLYDSLQELPSCEAEISEHVWSALQVESHDEEQFEDSGKRVRDLAQPLAEHGISILFKSTYFSDFILVKEARLQTVCDILQCTQGFIFHSAADEDEPVSPIPESGSRPQLSRSITGSLLLDKTVASSPPLTPAKLSSKPARASTPQRSQSQASDDLPSAAMEELGISNDDDQLQHLAERATSLPAADDPLASSMHSDGSLHLASSLYLLPDELACIGLNVSMEHLWREKLVKAMFYSADLLEQDSGPWSDPDADQARQQRTDSTEPRYSGSRRRRRREARTLATFAQESLSPRQLNSTGLGATIDAELPLPFFSFTSTSDNASLVLDVRLLRALFSEESSQGMVFTVGGEGVAGLFRGEQGVEVRGEELATTPRGRAGGRPSDADDWTQVEQVESGRQIMKCLMLDLTAHGLDKKGIVNAVTQALSDSAATDLIYSSTFSTACVLVAKTDLESARAALERLA